jgi:hypothetical protein
MNNYQCPVCKSQSIEGHDYEVMENQYRQLMTCLDCDAEFDHIYTLTAVRVSMATIHAER